MRNIILCLLLVLGLPVMAQKPEELQNSYNYKRGIELFNGDTPDLKGAMDCFQKEIADHPKNGYAYYYMGLIYDHYNQEGDALQNITKAIEYLKKDKDWISYAYRLRANVNIQLGHDNLALEDWKSSLKANPNDNSTLADRAEYYYGKKMYDLSDADYDQLIKAYPGDGIGYKGKGRNANDRQNYQKGLELFSYAITLDPQDAAAYANRGKAYLEMKKYADASDDVIKAIDIDQNRYAVSLLKEFKDAGKDVLLAKLRIKQATDKNNGLWSFLEGIVYNDNDEYLRAIKCFQQSDNISAAVGNMAWISDCYSSYGDYLKALDYIHRAMMRDSTDADYIYAESRILSSLGLYRDAISSINRYIQRSPDDANGYYRKSAIEIDMRKLDDAVTDLTTAIVLAPINPNVYLQRANCYKQLGKTEAAIADYKKVVELDTAYNDNNCVQFAFAALGEKDKDLAWQDTIFSHAQDKGTYYNAACLYSRLGEADKAISYLKMALEKGYRDFYHIKGDLDLDPIRNREDFISLIEEYQEKTKQLIANDEGTSDNMVTDVKKTGKSRISEIPFTRDDGNLCKVKCSVNGLPLNFWLDTGASDVSLSVVEATFMLKNGYLTKDDIVGTSYFLDANGNVSEGTVVNLRNVTFGDSELKNVHASVVGNLKAPLLLGQSVLSRLGSVEIDNSKSVIRIKYFNE